MKRRGSVKKFSPEDDKTIWRLARSGGSLERFYQTDESLKCGEREVEIDRKLLRDHRGLGPALRLRAILRFLGARQDRFFQEAKDRYGNDIDVKTSNLDRIFQLGNGNSVPGQYKDLLGAVAAWIDDQRQELGPLGRAALFEATFDGEDAVEDFTALLRAPSAQPLINARPFFIGEDKNRKNLKAEVLAEIAGVGIDETSAPVKRPKLLNVYAESAWSGLAAFAALIAQEATMAGHAVLVVPLRRPRETSPDKALPRPEVLGLPQILGILLAFIREGLGSVARAPDLNDVDDVGCAIHEIRLGLARKPAVLIFDGYFLPQTGYDPIERHIGDDDLLDIIWRLLDPPICSGESVQDASSGLDEVISPLDLARYAENRIVVTSNRRLPDLKGVNPIFSALTPSPENFVDILSRQSLAHRREVAWLYGKERLKNRPVGLAPLLDAFVGAVLAIEGTWDEGVGPLPDRLPRAPNASAVEYAESTMRNLLRYLSEKRPVWADLLRLVALTPDGVRPDSVVRFAKAAVQLGTDVRPFGNLARAYEAETLDGAIRAASNALASIFGLVRADVFDGIDGVAHPLELEEDPSSERMVQRGRSLDFIYPDLKLAVRSVAVKGLEPGPFHAAQRLLAREALRQQTISLRHADGTNIPSIRPWRRMLSAFHHGLQSLPIGTRPDGTSYIDELELGADDLISTGSAEEYWRYLYAFCYRRMIERPPAWNLSRLYGLDELKAVLLDAFNRPWTLWPEEMPARRPETSEVEGLIDELHERARHDWAVSIAQAEIARGDLETASKIVRAKAGTAFRPVSALKRDMDVRLLQCEPIRHLVDSLSDGIRSVFENENAIVHLDAVTEHLFQVFQNGNMFASETEFRKVEGVSTKEVVNSFNAQARSEISDITDIYFRLAEERAIKADLANAVEFEGWRPAQRPGILDDSLQDENQIAREFCASLSYYLFAEQLRLGVFSGDPIGNHFFASGHQMRQAIRVALKLERMTRQRSGRDQEAVGTAHEQKKAPEIGLFGRFARQNANRLTRHLFRYPRERASQLILESSMLRHLAPAKTRPRHLFIARRYIAEAEKQVTNLGSSARVRMRLNLERSKLSRELWRVSTDAAERKIYEGQCRFDIDSIDLSSQNPDLPLWRAIAAIQKNKLEFTLKGVDA